MIQKTIYLLFSIFAILSLLACDSNRVFETYNEMPDCTWHRDSLVSFDIRITDTKSPHNVLIDLRNEGSYKSCNLFLFVEISSPNGNSIKDTVELMLANQYGKWYGTGIGDLFDHQMMYKRFIFFPDTGIYSFEFEQAMRVEELEHICNFGIRIEKAEQP